MSRNRDNRDKAREKEHKASGSKGKGRTGSVPVFAKAPDRSRTRRGQEGLGRERVSKFCNKLALQHPLQRGTAQLF